MRSKTPLRHSPSSGTQRDGDAPDALAAGDQLVAEGRRLDAIDLLQRENWTLRDSEVEQRLARLRHEAFDELEPAPRLPAWPPPVPAGTRGDGTGPLTMSADELNVDALREGIFGHGSIHVRKLVPEDRVASLTEGIDRAFQAYDARATGDVSPADAKPWFDPLIGRDFATSVRRKWTRDGGGIWAADSPPMLFELIDTLHAVGLGALIADHFGERPALSMNKCVLRRVGLDSKNAWHQDGAFLGDSIRAVNVWVALSECGRDAPGLDIVGRRLETIAETGTEGATFDWSVAPDVVERVSGGAVVRPIFEAGDALLFDDLMLHQTACDPGMSRERYALEAWFFAPTGYPDDQTPLVF